MKDVCLKYNRCQDFASSDLLVMRAVRRQFALCAGLLQKMDPYLLAIIFMDAHNSKDKFNHALGYAYILTHPRIPPSSIYDHFYDSSDSIHDQIVKLVQQYG